MIRLRAAARAALLAATAFVSACGDGGMLFGGDGKKLDAQIAHPSGVVLQLLEIRSASDRTAVDLLILNGRDREITLNQGRDNSYILTDGGEKLMLVPPAANGTLAVPATRSANITLVFEGALPRSGSAMLVLNDSGSADSEGTSVPRFQVDLALDGAGGAVAKESTMANLRPVPMTTLARTRAQGSAIASGAGAGSTLERVDALKSELGAVDTERGTVVSLAGDVTFDFDKATLRADARPKLDRLAQLIQAGDAGLVSIEGHSDSRGDDAYNQRLSLARAEGVKAYLIEKGVGADRLKALGLGETRPVSPNAKPDGSDDEAGRQKNRRVEVILPKSNGSANPT